MPWQDLGSLPDWVEALGTSGALFFLAAQVQSARKKDREQRAEALEERRAAEEERRDREAMQARQITVTHGWNYSQKDGYTISVFVDNDSDQVIRHLALKLADAETGVDALDVDATVAASLRQTEVRLKAGAQAAFGGAPKPQPTPRLDGNDDAGFKELDRKLRIGVEFTDAAGLRWSQYEDGIPRRRIEADLGLRWKVQPMVRPPTPEL